MKELNGIIYYNMTEAAEKTGCSRPTIRKYLKSGRLPHYQIGKRKYVMQADVEDYLRDKRANR